MMKKAVMGAVIVLTILTMQVGAFASYMTYAVRTDGAALIKAETADKNINIADKFRGEKITGIGADVFRGNETLESVKLPETISYIEWGAFEDCKNLSNINLPDQIEMIEDMTFLGCAKLTDVTLPKELKSIGVKAFAGTALSELEIPDGTMAIDIAAFENCASLTRVVIPDSVVYIGENAFSGCDKLTAVCAKGGAAESCLKASGIACTVK